MIQDIDSDTWVNKRKHLKSLSIEVDFDMIKKIEIKKSDDNYLKEEPYFRKRKPDYDYRVQMFGNSYAHTYTYIRMSILWCILVQKKH